MINYIKKKIILYKIKKMIKLKELILINDRNHSLLFYSKTRPKYDSMIDIFLISKHKGYSINLNMESLLLSFGILNKNNEKFDTKFLSMTLTISEAIKIFSVIRKYYSNINQYAEIRDLLLYPYGFKPKSENVSIPNISENYKIYFDTVRNIRYIYFKDKNHAMKFILENPDYIYMGICEYYRIFLSLF